MDPSPKHTVKVSTGLKPVKVNRRNWKPKAPPQPGHGIKMGTGTDIPEGRPKNMGT